MALTATVYHLRIDLSDVDRGVYESLDLRLARHPSETMRFLLLRALAYCLCFEEGIAFSKGLSSTDEPAVWTREGDGRVTRWIDIGRPSMERLHKARKLTDRVAVFTADDASFLQREARGAKLHRGDDIALWCVDPALLDALEAKVDRNTALTVVHTEGALYVTVGEATLQGTVRVSPLVEPT